MFDSGLRLPCFIAHRGAMGYAPENTLAAFRKAQALGFEWVEFDIQSARCGELVVIHDETLDRTTNGSGQVLDKGYQELSKLDAGSWFSSEFANEKLPKLTDVITCLTELRLGANFELKPVLGQEKIIAEKFNALLKTWPDHLPAPLVSSFSLTMLREVRKLNKDVHIGLLFEKLPAHWQKLVTEFNSISVHLANQNITQAKIIALKQANQKVLVYTVNSRHRADKLFAWGVDAVFTNYSVF